MTDSFARAARRSLRQMGRDLTLINGTNYRRDDRNDPVWDDDPTPTVGEVVQRGTPSFNRREDGISSSVDALVWVASDDPVTSGEGDQETKATRIEDGDQTYVVRDVFDENNGLKRCHCERES